MFIKSVCDECYKGKFGICHYPELCIIKAMEDAMEDNTIIFQKDG